MKTQVSFQYINSLGMYKDRQEYKDCRMQEWNPLGNSLMYEDYNFPIVALVNYTEVQFLKDDVSETNLYYFVQIFSMSISKF